MSPIVPIISKSDIDGLDPGTRVEAVGRYQTKKRASVLTDGGYEHVDAFELLLSDEPISLHLPEEFYERELIYGTHLGQTGRSGRFVERGDSIYVRAVVNIYTDPSTGEEGRMLWVDNTRVLPATLTD